MTCKSRPKISESALAFWNSRECAFVALSQSAQGVDVVDFEIFVADAKNAFIAEFGEHAADRLELESEVQTNVVACHAQMESVG